jgi:surface antigen
MLDRKDAVIKSLGIGILLALISGCSSTTISTADGYQKPTTAIGVVYNIFKHEYHKLDKESYNKHQACLATSLYNSNYGNRCDWSTNTARGQVMVADMYRAGSKTCKTLRSSIIDTNGQTFTMNQKACGSGNNWRFIKV